MRDESDKNCPDYCQNNVTYWPSNGNNGSVFSGVLEIVRVKGGGFAPAIGEGSTTKKSER